MDCQHGRDHGAQGKVAGADAVEELELGWEEGVELEKEGQGLGVAARRKVRLRLVVGAYGRLLFRSGGGWRGIEAWGSEVGEEEEEEEEDREGRASQHTAQVGCRGHC